MANFNSNGILTNLNVDLKDNKSGVLGVNGLNITKYSKDNWYELFSHKINGVIGGVFDFRYALKTNIVLTKNSSYKHIDNVNIVEYLDMPSEYKTYLTDNYESLAFCPISCKVNAAYWLDIDLKLDLSGNRDSSTGRYNSLYRVYICTIVK